LIPKGLTNFFNKNGPLKGTLTRNKNKDKHQVSSVFWGKSIILSTDSNQFQELASQLGLLSIVIIVVKDKLITVILLKLLL
jgi:hypothetical protein